MQNILNWIVDNYIEAIGTIASFIYLYFSIKQKIWLWPLGLISSALYVYIFLSAKIYADMGLQVYYVLISIYGWYYWLRQNKTNKIQSKVKSAFNSDNLVVYLVLSSLFLFIFLSQLLINFTDSTIPYLDALTTALSIVATWMLAKRYIEHWMVWIFVDALSSVIYVYKDLYFTVFLYIVYTVMAVVGLRTWKVELKMSILS